MSSDWNHYKSLAEQSIQSGDYEDAESLWFAALQTVAFESEADPRLPLTLDGLANACSLLRKYAEAERLYWDSIKIKEKYCGFESLETAASLKGLAGVYYEQNQFKEAEALGKRLLAMLEALLGSSNDEVSECAMHLVAICHKQKKTEEAQLFYQKALEARGVHGQRAVSTPFTQRTIKPTSVCPVCQRTYVGESCLMCTQTSLKTVEKIERY